ncbi:MAG: hypothetical protein GY913_31920 [Proteobacteria bacterium]|nr:hypothetical protein [Pseudomonadota bacterium]MCP4921528.1 hypothetical protein [Pseudomonadota bacterium]
MRFANALLAAALLSLTVLVAGGSAHAKKDTVEFGTSVEKDHYMVQVYSGKAGIAERGHVTVVVTAMQGYSLDNEHDIIVKMKSPPSDVQWGQSKLHRLDGMLSDDGKSFTMEVPYRAGRMGEFPVAGKVKFKLCRAGQCKGGRARFKTSVHAR